MLTWFKLEGWRVKIARRADFEGVARLDDSAFLGDLEPTETGHQEMQPFSKLQIASESSEI